VCPRKEEGDKSGRMKKKLQYVDTGRGRRVDIGPQNLTHRTNERVRKRYAELKRRGSSITIAERQSVARGHLWII